MEHAQLETVENDPNQVADHSVRRPVSSELDTDAVAINQYRLDPGEGLSGGLHTHLDQEEIFLVTEGTTTFTTTSGPGEDREQFTVEEGEVVRFAPGEYQQGTNETDEPVRVLAIGAPGARNDTDKIRSLVECRECEQETAHGLEFLEGGAFELTCQNCGNSFVVNR